MLSWLWILLAFVVGEFVGMGAYALLFQEKETTKGGKQKC